MFEVEDNEYYQGVVKLVENLDIKELLAIRVKYEHQGDHFRDIHCGALKLMVESGMTLTEACKVVVWLSLMALSTAPPSED